MNTKKQTLWIALSVLLVAAFVLSACGGGTTPAPAAQPTQAPAAQPTAAPAQPTTGSGSFLDRALAGEFKGQKVTATGPFVDADAQKFNATMKEFVDKTGIDIQYQGSKEFEASIKAAIDSGTAPDVIDFPQPGLLASFAKQGKIMDLSKYLNMDALKANYNPYWLDQAMMDGTAGKIMAGVWERVNGKGFVYYPKKAWDASGYKIPTTYEELKTVMDQMVADGTPPWCIGIESGAATGWVATDWMENIMLRTTTPENYDAWVQGKLKFASPEVTKAAQIMADIWTNPKYVYGGNASIVKTSFGDSTLPMFDAKGPKCFMNMNGNFITSFFPQGLKAGEDYGAFYFPPIDPTYGSPAEVAGDIWGATNDKPATMAVMEYFTKGEHLKEWMKQGGAIAPQKDADLSWYGSPIDKVIGEAIVKANTLRFDGSDSMPGAVGAGSFWKEMTSFVAGAEDLNTALKNIDASWPASTPGTSTTPAAQSFLDRALAGEFKGKKVTATGPFVDADAQKFNATMKEFVDKTGIEIQYQGSKEFEASIKAAIDSGTAPDVIDFPQPGLLASFAKQGKIMDLSKYLNMDALKANYNPYWLDQAMMDGAAGKIMAGVWERVNGKGFVYYPKKAWDASGYKIPTTYEELKTVMDQMVADGTPPWCIGIESGAATGWVATDWMENIMLRTTTPENYDAWVQGKLKFASPEVTKAAQIMADIWTNPKYVYGGNASIVKTSFGDSTLPMFDAKGPKCFMNMNGNFITSFFPQGLTAGVDYGAFYFPPIDATYGSPAEVAGDIWGATNDRPEVMAVMEYFTKGEHLKEWMKQGGAIAPQKDADLSWYGSPIDKVIGEAIVKANTLRFDGSDSMPGAVGAGSFWKEMTSFVAGAEDLNTALKNIDASWPK